jgi:hypothetical protein
MANHLIRIAAVACVVLYGALLRFDAISQEYDFVRVPRWVARMQVARQDGSVLRPTTVRWQRSPRFPHRDGPPSQYRSDPYTYLQRARQMRSFYGAHLREPVFPYTTKVLLALLHDDDVAVSFASGIFSGALIIATFLLGRLLFGFGVGLAAAVLTAVEYDLITQGSQGCRDDAFACGVVLTVAAMVAWMQKPSRALVILIGVSAGLTGLVRISAFSFILPGFLYLMWASGPPRTARIKPLTIALAVTVAIVCPFLLNCWRAYGDPFYAINAHADVYRTAEMGTDPVGGVGPYLAGHFRTHPMATIDTVVIGLTQYPFANKWTGFNPWLPGLGTALSWFAIVGLVMMGATASGRLVLIAFATSMLPYAFTWKLISDWRFTEHMYPLFLIAACGAIGTALLAIKRRAVIRAQMPSPRDLGACAALLLLLIAGWLLMTRVMPPLVVKETLRAGEPATIQAGSRDRAFFGSDWPLLTTSGAVSTRVATGSRASIWIPLPAATDYEALVRIDPDRVPVTAGATIPSIDILLNGRWLSTCDSGSDPERVGICRFWIPAAASRRGENRLSFTAKNARGFRVWYVRVQHPSK